MIVIIGRRSDASYAARKLAAREGIEPPLKASKAPVRPLHQRAILQTIVF